MMSNLAKNFLLLKRKDVELQEYTCSSEGEPLFPGKKHFITVLYHPADICEHEVNKLLELTENDDIICAANDSSKVIDSRIVIMPTLTFESFAALIKKSR